MATTPTESQLHRLHHQAPERAAAARVRHHRELSHRAPAHPAEAVPQPARREGRHRRRHGHLVRGEGLGRTDTFRAEITEPEPGRVLVEKNIAGSDSVTTFIVEPGARADEAIVTITTEMTRRGGLAGAIEQFMTERVLRPMYAEELRLLEAAAADPHGTAAVSDRSSVTSSGLREARRRRSSPPLAARRAAGCGAAGPSTRAGSSSSSRSRRPASSDGCRASAASRPPRSAAPRPRPAVRGCCGERRPRATSICCQRRSVSRSTPSSSTCAARKPAAIASSPK